MIPRQYFRSRGCAIGATAAAVVLVLVSPLTRLAPATAAGTPAGSARIVHTGAPPPTGHGGEPLDSGGSATEFTLQLPSNASCPGDSANDGYKVQTYMVSGAVDPATLQFGSQGPTGGSVGNHATFKQPLYTASGSAVVNKQTQDKTATQPRGVILEFEPMSFAVYAPGNIPPGTYNVGAACTLGGAGDAQMKEFWNVQLTFTASESDSPAKVTWTAANGSATTTTTTTAAGGGGVTTTSTTVAGATTTTSTTLAAGSGTATTTTTAVSGGSAVTSTTSTTAAASAAVLSNASGAPRAAGTLSRTGVSPWTLLAWAFVLLAFGRMAFVLSRPARLRKGIDR